jgi:cation diffusion facilitator family transporter
MIPTPTPEQSKDRHQHFAIKTSNARRKTLSTRAILIGLAINVLLAVFKLIIGRMSGSLAISADAWNNVSDAASSMVSLISIILSAKPADEKHPFGHARFEYIASMVIAIAMLIVAFQFGRTSIERIISPIDLTTDVWTFVVLIASILLKILQFIIYRKWGRKIQSPILLASSKDSIADVYITSGVVASAILYAAFGFNLDGPVGLIISIAIGWSAIEIILNAATLLIGSRPSKELTLFLQEKILKSDPRILDMHDLIVHDYGPGRVFATAHVELDSQELFPEVHLITDRIERKMKRDYGINLLLHAEPSYPHDEAYTELLGRLDNAAKEIIPNAVVHSLFLFKSQDGKPIAAFDVDIDDKTTIDNKTFFSKMQQKMVTCDPNLNLWITIDREYTSHLTEESPSSYFTLNDDVSI